MTATLATAVAPAPTVWPWVRACIAAETVGMTAAATAAVLAGPLPPAAALSVVVLGGLVEGTALGWWQSRVLHDRFPRLRRRRYAVATLVVAGLGWAAASAPAAFADDDASAVGPPLALVLVMAAGLGLVMGALLGAVQARALPTAVPRPGRWVGASAVGWTPTMAVIFLGATTPDATWPAAAVVATGAVTGAVAGAVLGLVSGAFLPTLDGPPASSRLVVRLLGLRVADRPRRALVGLEVVGRRTGRVRRFPVQYAALDADADAGAVVVVPGGAERKSWWRNIARTGTAVRVLGDGGRWVPAEAWLLDGTHRSPEYDAARRAYERRWDRVLPVAQPVVVVRRTTVHDPRPAGAEGPGRTGRAPLGGRPGARQGGDVHILRTDHDPHPHAVCAHCHQVIVEVDGVGWIDPDGADSYDVCPGDGFGNHLPQRAQP